MLTALVRPAPAADRPGVRHQPRCRSAEQPDERPLRHPGRGRSLCFFAALITQGFLPFFETSARTTKVSSVVRTDLGQLKWMITDATDYTPLQQRGRDVYLREGCWYCHSQFVRPVTGETRRWGPVAELGEFAFDVPHLFGTRRIGPDLLRVGLKYSDEWHYAHFWNPRMLTPDSVMAPYRGLFDTSGQRVGIVDDGAGNRTLEKTPRTEALFDFASQQQIRLTPNSDGHALRAAEGARQSAGHPVADRRLQSRYGPDRRRDGGSRSARRLCPEARHEPRQVARPVRAAAARGDGCDVPALGGMDPARQGSLRAALPRLPRRRPATATGLRRPSCSTSARATSTPPSSSSG